MLCGASEDEAAFEVWFESLRHSSSLEHSGLAASQVFASHRNCSPFPDAIGEKYFRPGQKLIHSESMESPLTSLQLLCDPLDRDQSPVPIGADLLQPSSGLTEL